MVNEQPEALRLADDLQSAVQTYPQMSEDEPGGYCRQEDQLMDEAAAELRRLHAENAELLEVLKDVVPHLEYMAGGMTHAAWKTKEAQECLERTKYAIAKTEGDIDASR